MNDATLEDSQGESRHDSDSVADATFLLVCLDCGHVEETPDGDEHIVDAKENSLDHLGSAEVLKQAHEALRPTHRPFIETHVARSACADHASPDSQCDSCEEDDVHYPEWAETRRDRILGRL